MCAHMGVYVCVCVWFARMCVDDQNRVSDPLELEIIGSGKPPNVDTGNQTQILGRYSKLSSLQNHLAGP